MTLQQFIQFVNGQRDPRLNEILYPYCNEEKGKDLIKQYEPNELNAKVYRCTVWRGDLSRGGVSCDDLLKRSKLGVSEVISFIAN